MTCLCFLQAMVAENTSASLQLSRLEEQLSLVSSDLTVLLRQVSQHLLNSTLFLKPAEMSFYVPSTRWSRCRRSCRKWRHLLRTASPSVHSNSRTSPSFKTKSKVQKYSKRHVNYLKKKDYSQPCDLIGPALQKDVELLNETTEEQLTTANKTYLLQEIEFMLQSIRVINLTAASTAANQELL